VWGISESKADSCWWGGRGHQSGRASPPVRRYSVHPAGGRDDRHGLEARLSCGCEGARVYPVTLGPWYGQLG
jgi:hypothetical protein